MADFTPFDDRLAGIVAALSPSGRRRMAYDMAKKLRRQQQQRIKAQLMPDGTPFAPRKREPVRGKKGRVRREMFVRLRANRFMTARGDEDIAAVQFTGRVQRIARVHQFGLSDKPSAKSAAVKYSQRELLGFSDKDRETVERIIIEHLAC